jgi:hypothetical protein
MTEEEQAAAVEAALIGLEQCAGCKRWFDCRRRIDTALVNGVCLTCWLYKHRAR